MAQRADDDYRYRFGSRVRELRLAAGLTQEQVAHRWGASTVTISKIENGRMNPGAWGLPGLASALEVERADLYVSNDS